MYEELYQSLPDVDLYLSRIGFTTRPKANYDNLKMLISQHQMYIPFEDIDVRCYKKSISLGIKDLFDKVILGGRGGYCFELNALFYALLKELGYQVRPCMCKVLEGPGPYYIASHRGSIVTIDSSDYYCDIGFGGPVPPGPLKFQEDLAQQIGPNTYKLLALREHWWQLNRINSQGKEIPMLQINDLAFDLVDFLSMNLICHSHQDQSNNRFTDHLVLNIRTKDGHASIEDDLFTLRKEGQVSRQIIDDATAHRLCKEVFRITADLSDITLVP